MSGDAERRRIYAQCEAMGEAAVRAELESLSCIWGEPKQVFVREWLNRGETTRQEVQDGFLERSARAAENQMYASWGSLLISVIALAVAVYAAWKD